MLTDSSLKAFKEQVELRRRYSEFDNLREILLRRYPAMLLNPLPPKKAVNNTSEETVLLRMKSKHSASP